jgi:hypothetical protein
MLIRTAAMHQVEAKAQMVVVAKRKTETDLWVDTDDEDEEVDETMDTEAMSGLADTMAELAQVRSRTREG